VSTPGRFTPHMTTLAGGPRRVLALHCSLAHGGAWRGVAEAVRHEATLIAPDMPSHGASPDWDRTQSFAETALSGALSSLDATPMDVIAHSFGAVIALALALHAPDRVRSLWLYEPVLFAAARQIAPDAVAAYIETARPCFEALESGALETGTRLFHQAWGDGTPWDALPDRAQAAMVRAIPGVIDTKDVLQNDALDLLERLGKITAPTHLVQGGRSPGIMRAIQTGLAKRLPNCTATTLPELGHMGPLTHADQIAAHWNAARPTLPAQPL